MQTYAQLNEAGVCIGLLQVELAHTPPQFGPEMVPVATMDTSLIGRTYSAGAWSAVPAPARHVTQLAFGRRFTRPERVALELAALDDPSAPMPQRQQAADLRVYLADVAAARYIDLDRADTRAGVQALEAAGLLASGRAVQILDAPVQPAERT